MPLTPGTRLGPYEIVAPLGAGGMGEVYRSRDTRLGRDVAIKILPPGFAANEELRARFEREARTVSSLNHPNICTLFDVGREDGTHFLVMELIEGETLAERLQKGPLPLEQVLRYGAQIADALGRAHRQGIVHRDLKPGNVMITKAGAKLLDFGLARSGPEASPVHGLTAMATQAAPLTQEGTILGTFQYMAPEQLEGIEVDARTDIFAFGALLYEMTTGKRAFEGATRTSLIAAIVSGTPRPMGELIPLTPPALEHVVRRCLEKEPDDRWQSAADIGNQLRWISEAGSRAGEAAPLAARRRFRLRTAWALNAATAAAAVIMTLAFATLRHEPMPAINSSVLPPKDLRFDSGLGAAVLAPDGQRLAFVAVGQDGKSALWIRTFSTGSAQLMPGTERATHPVWSPDSRQVAFFSLGKLRRIDAAGGPPQAICDAADGRGAAWGSGGTILFTPGTGMPLHRVPVTGGTPVAETALDSSRSEVSHRYAEFLPDGKHYLFLVESAAETPGTDQGFAVFAGELGSKQKKLVVATNGQARYSPATGYLLFVRAGTLVAQKFDPRTQGLSGEALPVAENVKRSARFEADFSISRNGLLAFEVGSATEPAQLVLIDRSGRDVGLASKTVADYRAPRFSRDESRVVAAIADPGTTKGDIWVLDVARGTSTRLTFDPESDWAPFWSPDDRKIYFSSSRAGKSDVYSKSSSGTGKDEPVYGSPNPDYLWTVSPDGATAWVVTFPPKMGSDILRLDLQTGQASVFMSTPFNETHPVPSPDGRWLAYTSNESGRDEIYVQSLLDDGGKWQISTDGGSRPAWTRGGREIIYQGADRKLVAVDIRLEPMFQAGTPNPLFDPRARVQNLQAWDVSADGERFLVNRAIETRGVEPITLVQNWPATLKK
ncbi:MAG: protein kinase [Candidatus Eisenbacteria bacterium]|nr:protein kinase [Candidatus Eisenbacteria bacterium]